MNYNKVMLAGNLTRDVELRHLRSGSAVGGFGLAINRKFTDGSGEKREEVVFVDCKAFGKTAETLAKYVQKGSGLFVEGRLKLDQWTDKASGEKRSKLKVVVDGFQFVGGKGEKPAAAKADGPPSFSSDDIAF